MEAVLASVAELKFSAQEPPSLEMHERIHALVKEVMEQEGHTKKSEPVPIDILRFAVYNILFPTFNVNLTGSLLDLLASVEFHRQTHMKIIGDYLLSMRANATEDLTELDPDLATNVRFIVSNDPALRDMFLEIVKMCCAKHIYESWVSGPMTDFWLHLNRYLPTASQTGAFRCAFYHTLSEEETTQVEETVKECINAITTGYDRFYELADGRISFTKLVQTGEFRDYSAPMSVVESEQLCVLIKTYVDTVNDDAKVICFVSEEDTVE
ncbi:hypothetical protein FA15DRAFT_450671 [Coprinopsis marcescibilis]|uniref:Uncharacterized protein n=1 Tax=Coprinopsis marcescibilis TaxID=230819 RepID=A0A5C3KSX2_COPMA|nr:hypothetical protein FA15DRAFT_450671 [Coprinopsis marcescibilis]